MKRIIAGLSAALVLAFATVLPAADTAPAATPAAPPAASAVQPKPTATAPLPAVPQLKIPDIAKAPSSDKAAVGEVNLSEVGTSEPGKAASRLIKARIEKLQAVMKSRQKELDKLQESFRAKAAGMTQEQKLAAEKEFRRKVESYQQFVKNGQKELQEKEAEVNQKIEEKVKAAAARLAKEGNYILIIPRKVMFYTSDKVGVRDVTAEIIRLLNEEKKK